MRLTAIVPFLFALLFVPALPAQEFVANINRSNLDGDIRNLQANADWAVYTANDGLNGDRLFVISQPGAEPEPFAATLPTTDARIVAAYLIGDRVYYSALLGVERGPTITGNFYVADLAAGTNQLLIADGTENFNAQSVANVVDIGGEQLLFFSFGGAAIWRTDGTSAGTRYVTTTEGSAFNAVSLEGALAIWAADGRIYRSDGTESGTFAIRNFQTGAFSFDGPVVAGDRAFLLAQDSDGALKLFETDGSVAGTLALRERDPAFANLAPRQLSVFESGLYFTSRTADGISSLYRYGNQELETLVSLPDDERGAFLFNVKPGEPFTYFNRIGDNALVTLWRTNGTEAGTEAVRSIFLFPEEQSNAGRQTARGADGKFFFIGQDAEFGTELFVTGPGPADADIAVDFFEGLLSSQIDQLTPFGDFLYVTANDGKTGRELYSVDTRGNEYSATMEGDANVGEAGSFPLDFTVVGDRLVFTAAAGCTGREVYATDGTASGTLLLKDADPGPGVRNLQFSATLGGELLYTATTRGSRKLWRSDGTPEGTRPALANGNEIFLPSLTNTPVVFGGKLILSGYYRDKGQQVLAYDPALETVDTIVNFGLNGSFVNGGPAAIVLNENTFLFPSNKFGDNRIFASDGTPGSAVELTDQVNEIFLEIVPTRSGIAYFVKPSGTAREIWRTDGTPQGTFSLQPLGPGFLYRSIVTSLPSGDGVYFSARSDPGDNGIYRYANDGSGATAITTPGGVDLEVNFSFNWEGATYISGRQNGADNELYQLRGNSNQILLLKDINPGPEGSRPNNFTVFDNQLYFTADDGTNGRELWRTDGSESGTELVADINPGSGDGVSTSLFDWDGTLYFGADDGISGSELWRYDPDNPNGTNPNNNPDNVSEICLVVDTEETPPETFGLSVYPNPARTKVSVDVAAGRPIAVTLIDPTGRTVHRVMSTLGPLVIPVSNLPAALYSLRVTDLATGSARTTKVMVSH